MQTSPKTLLIAIPIGLVFVLYLFLAFISIPPATHSSGHYNVGNNLAGAIFFSYAPFTWTLSVYVAPMMYIAYAYMALARLKRVGLILFALHYGFAALVAAPIYLKRTPGLLDETRRQIDMLAGRPWTMLFIVGPFAIVNLWYLARLLRNKE